MICIMNDNILVININCIFMICFILFARIVHLESYMRQMEYKDKKLYRKIHVAINVKTIFFR